MGTCTLYKKNTEAAMISRKTIYSKIKIRTKIVHENRINKQSRDVR